MNPDNYGSLEACKKLAEILAKKGIKTETDAAYYHIYHPAGNAYKWVLCPREGRTGASLQYDDEIPAYSMAEVWRGLREYGPCSDGNRWWLCDEGENTSHEVSDFNPADALIELWIWVLEQEGK